MDDGAGRSAGDGTFTTGMLVNPEESMCVANAAAPVIRSLPHLMMNEDVHLSYATSDFPTMLISRSSSTTQLGEIKLQAEKQLCLFKRTSCEHERPGQVSVDMLDEQSS